MLDKLEAAGVRLTAFELGNEINNSVFNGDLPAEGKGRELRLADLNNPNDSQPAPSCDGLQSLCAAYGGSERFARPLQVEPKYAHYLGGAIASSFYPI